MSLDTVKLIFAQRYNASADELSAESVIVDICNDSLEVLELLMYIEEEFGVEVPEDTVAEISKKLRENN